MDLTDLHKYIYEVQYQHQPNNMSIECKICKKVMAKQITNTHLKSHGLTTNEYKTRYGASSLTSAEYRVELSAKQSGANNSNFGKKWSTEQKSLMSDKTAGRIPWNKDKKIGQNENHKRGIEQREEKYKNGDLHRTSRPMTEELRDVLSAKQKAFFTDNPTEGELRAKKSVATKRKNNYDFGKTMRGKKHSDATKEKISEKSKVSNAIRSDIATQKRLEKINESNLALIDQNDDALNLVCKKCNNVFTLTKQCFTESKYKSTWCDVCYPREPSYRSKAEVELYDFVKSLDNDCVASSRQILKNKEIDIFLPSKKIAIEFNGLYWHCEDVLTSNGKSKHSDHIKMLEARNNNIRYIGILEDEWVHKKDIVKSRLKHILGVIDKKVFARKCLIREISSKVASNFCKENHIQSVGRSNVRYGLFFNDELVSVMTLTKSNISRKNKDIWEINRFCNKLDYTVVGGASRLFKHFLKNHDPESVISYSDNRWSEGDLYKLLNFEFAGNTSPNYWYFLPNSLERIHRYALRKTKNDPDDLSEKELRSMQGYLRIWDCGSIKWIWKKGT